MRSTIFALLICLVIGSTALAQENKPWSSWSKKDAEKILNSSAWSQTVIKGEAPVDMRVRSGSSANQSQGVQGPPPEPQEINFRIRLLSAKPIREAFAARLIVAQPDRAAELTPQLQTIIDEGFGDFIVVGVNADSRNPRALGAALRGLSMLRTDQLANKVYLERKDGKRLQLLEYKPPVADDMGGKFIFARSLDGEPFIAAGSGNFKFVLNLPNDMDLNARFDIGKLTYKGTLEF